MKNKQLPGQILVIVLLIISILSILLVSLVTYVRRDIREKIDTTKYEQLYSYGETNVLKTQEIVKSIQPASNIKCNTSIKTADVYGANVSYTGASSGNNINEGCVSTNFHYDINSDDTAKMTLVANDKPELKKYTVPQDGNLLIELLDKDQTPPVYYQGNVYLYWNEAASWIISFDSYDAASNYYITRKIVIKGNGSLKDGFSNCYTPPTDNDGWLSYAHRATLNIAAIKSSCGISNTVIGVRFKPLGTSATVGVRGETGFPNQFREIIGSISANNTTNAQDETPVPILSIEYPLTMQPLPLFDYVLRGGQTLKKP